MQTFKLKYLRIAPRKVRLVADVIRGKNAEQAQAILRFARKKAARPVRKLLDSAIASSKKDFQTDEKDLFVSKIFVDEGPRLKRWRPGSRGSAIHIEKRSSHVTLVLDSKAKGGPESGKRAGKQAGKQKKASRSATPEEMKQETKKPKSPEKSRPEKKLGVKGANAKIRGQRVFKRKAF